jgi:hypothetical protein
MRTRVQNALHAIAMAHGVRRGHTLWNREGQAWLASLPLAPHTAHRRSELRPRGTAELRARLEGYWTRTLDSLKARLENAAEERDSD